GAQQHDSVLLDPLVIMFSAGYRF
ncbi:outer membrane protein OmpW, partial [Escherichia coli]|nr:outer membrane protein OmpW [Escherichia coli]